MPAYLQSLGSSIQVSPKHCQPEQRQNPRHNKIKIRELWKAFHEAAENRPDPLIAIIDICHASPPPTSALSNNLAFLAASQRDELASDTEGGWLTQTILSALTKTNTTAQKRFSHLCDIVIQTREAANQKPVIHLGRRGSYVLNQTKTNKFTIPHLFAALLSLFLILYALPPTRHLFKRWLWYIRHPLGTTPSQQELLNPNINYELIYLASRIFIVSLLIQSSRRVTMLDILKVSIPLGLGYILFSNQTLISSSKIYAQYLTSHPCS